jgi:hypothetical protein
MCFRDLTDCQSRPLSRTVSSYQFSISDANQVCSILDCRDLWCPNLQCWEERSTLEFVESERVSHSVMISDTTPTYFNKFISRSSSLSSTLEFKLALFAAMGVCRYSDLLLSALGFNSLRILQGAESAVPHITCYKTPVLGLL